MCQTYISRSLAAIFTACLNVIINVENNPGGQTAGSEKKKKLILVHLRIWRVGGRADSALQQSKVDNHRGLRACHTCCTLRKPTHVSRPCVLLAHLLPLQCSPCGHLNLPHGCACFQPFWAARAPPFRTQPPPDELSYISKSMLTLFYMESHSPQYATALNFAINSVQYATALRFAIINVLNKRRTVSMGD